LALLVCVLLAAPVWSESDCEFSCDSDAACISSCVGLKSAVVRGRTCDGLCEWQHRVCRESGLNAAGCRWRLASCQTGCMEPTSSETRGSPDTVSALNQPDLSSDSYSGSPSDLRDSSCQTSCKIAFLNCHRNPDTCVRQLNSCMQGCF
jgi:hypothetical protein